MKTLTDELDVLALKAFDQERESNMNFWTMPVDDPEAVYWREVWKKGFLFRRSHEGTKELLESLRPFLPSIILAVDMTFNSPENCVKVLERIELVLNPSVHES